MDILSSQFPSKNSYRLAAWPMLHLMAHANSPVRSLHLPECQDQAVGLHSIMRVPNAQRFSGQFGLTLILCKELLICAKATSLAPNCRAKAARAIHVQAKSNDEGQKAANTSRWNTKMQKKHRMDCIDTNGCPACPVQHCRFQRSQNDMSSQATEPQPATRCAVPTKGCIQKNNLPWYGNKRLPNLV